MALLDVRDLQTLIRTNRGVVHAVDGVSFSVEPGRTLAIVGESGCGKSVTALSIMRLLPENATIAHGTVTFEGQDLTQLSAKELRRVRGRRIGMVFQDPMTSLNPTATVGAQIEEPLTRQLGLGRDQARKRAVELLEEVQIPLAAQRVRAYPHQFSGGMRQRVMIAAAIACSPPLLVADEPTTALDVTVQAQILDLLHELKQAHQMAMILITHDMGVVAEVADDVAVMYAGQFVEQAETRELFANPEHPYTEALLAALPRTEGDVRHERLAAIPGRPPDLIDPSPTCRFAPRCPYAELDDCRQTVLEFRELRSSHLVRSLHPASARAAVKVAG
jgi:oligopeptide/dipeptide ABC transporter ATP-binding protein